MIAATSFVIFALGLLFISQVKSVRRADLGCALVALAVVGAAVVGMMPYGLDRVPLWAVLVTLAVMAAMTLIAAYLYHWYWGGGREAYRLRRMGIDPFRKLTEDEK